MNKICIKSYFFSYIYLKGKIKMKQIIPFKKELLFKTKVSEITSISLEHTLTLRNDDLISGEFYISGDYKMTEGSINREKFQFKLPFDIALDSRYDISSIIIDIDNFYYEIINNEALQVNIDVYVEGKKIEEPEIIQEITVGDQEIIQKVITGDQGSVLSEETDDEVISLVRGEEVTNSYDTRMDVEVKKEESVVPVVCEEEFETSVVSPSVPKVSLDQKRENNLAEEFNLFENMDNSDTYVTYYVYVVKEDDTLEKVLSKYQITKEDLELYNNTLDIKPGEKLIIPSGCND